MPTINPFPDDPVKAEVFEQGYAAGFMDPDSNDFRPLAPELLAVFQQGFQGGRVDRSAPPAADGSCRWLTNSEVAHSEALEHLVLLILSEALDHTFKTGGLFGMGDLVFTALGLQDTPLQELPPDFRADFNRAQNDPAIHYLAMCPRSDHSQTTAGVTSDGYWVGPDRNSFFGALDDMTSHGHSEGIVTRCDLNVKQCGAVWLGLPT